MKNLHNSELKLVFGGDNPGMGPYDPPKPPPTPTYAQATQTFVDGVIALGAKVVEVFGRVK